MTKVINFCAGPSAGKTTAGLTLAGIMKTQRMNVLYVPEVAMELVVAGRIPELDDQLWLLGEQSHRLYMAKGQFDYIVTDAPIFMMMHYVKANAKKYDSLSWQSSFNRICMATFVQFENYTFYVDRGDRKFLQTGRVQNEEQSKAIDGEILTILHDNGIDYRVAHNAEHALENLRARKIVPRA